MVTVVTPGDKRFLGRITNADYLRLTGRPAMPAAYRFWLDAAKKGHGNPLFDVEDEQYWFAAFPGGKATARVVELWNGDYVIEESSHA